MTTTAAPPATRIVTAATASVVLLVRLAGTGSILLAQMLAGGHPGRSAGAIGVLVAVTLLELALVRRGPHWLPVLVVDAAALTAVLVLAHAGPAYFSYGAASGALAAALLGWAGWPVWVAISAQEYVTGISLLRTAGAWTGPDGIVLAAPSMPLLFGAGVAFAHQMLTRHLVRTAEQVAAARLEERERLAREMHDSVATTLHGVSLAAAMLPDLLRREPRLALQLADEISRGALSANQEARDLVQGLRLDRADVDLRQALTDLGRAWSQQSGVPVSVDVAVVPAGPDLKYEMTRIVHEALTNVARHAKATAVEVSLSRVAAGLELRVRDDGSGFAVPADLGVLPRSGHAGIVGMTERAANVGGRFEIASEPGVGTTIRVEVPA